MERYGEVESILSEYSGLDVQSIGRQMFERALDSRLAQACGGSYSDYVGRLTTEEDERACLLDLLVIPETWFFRDSGAFSFLTTFVKSEWSGRTNGRVLHVLSAPCSTGEEPYSIAMTLLEAGLNPPQFRIHALDISPKAIVAAQAGRYGRTSFRRPLTAVQNRFLLREREWTAVCEPVRSSVKFSRGNMVAPDFFAGSDEVFDVVFCKNLMIYLGEDGRAKVIACLNRLLKERGLLFVGHSEVALFQKAGFEPIASARAFGLRKVTKASDEQPARRLVRRRRVVAEKQPGALLSKGGRSRPETRPVATKQAEGQGAAVAAIDSARSLLDTARNLADRGDLQEAARLCRSLIGAGSMDVGAYYLAGLIEQSLDRLAPAEDLFLKAIYLAPDHYETLVQLCLLSEKRGDSVKAGQYRKRIRRLEESGRTTD